MTKERSLYTIARVLSYKIGLELAPAGSSTYGPQPHNVDATFREHFHFTGNIRTHGMACHINVPERLSYPGIQDWFVYRASKIANGASPLDLQSVISDEPTLMIAIGDPTLGVVRYASSISPASPFVESEAIYLWSRNQAKALVITHGVLNTKADFTVYMRDNMHATSSYFSMPLPRLDLTEVANGGFNSFGPNKFEIVVSGKEKPILATLEDLLKLPRNSAEGK